MRVLGTFRNLDPDLCVPENPEFITGCSVYLSFPHCQYTATLDLIHFRKISARQISEITIVKKISFWRKNYQVMQCIVFRGYSTPNFDSYSSLKIVQA